MHKGGGRNRGILRYMYIRKIIIIIIVHVTCKHNFYEKTSLAYMYVHVHNVCTFLHLVYVHVHVCSSSFVYPGEHEDITPLSSDR